MEEADRKGLEPLLRLRVALDLRQQGARRKATMMAFSSAVRADDVGAFGIVGRSTAKLASQLGIKHLDNTILLESDIILNIDALFRA